MFSFHKLVMFYGEYLVIRFKIGTFVSNLESGRRKLLTKTE